MNLFSLYRLSNIAYWWSCSLKRPVRRKPDNRVWAYIFCLLKGMYWEQRALLVRGKESTCIQSSPPPTELWKKIPPFFPTFLSFPIYFTFLHISKMIYSATMSCLWMLNVQCKDLYFFFCLEAFVVNLLLLPQCYTQQNWKRKQPHKAVPHLRIVLYFSRQIKIFNKLCTF